MEKDTIVVVSGLPRSGTSMMMRMLDAGGLEILTDNLREADEDNPRGYYEVEAIKKLNEDNSWVGDAKGKTIKVISALLESLPSEYEYKVIFMRRKLEEVLASQRQMLVRRGEPTDKIKDEELTPIFRRHLRNIDVWLRKQPNIDLLYVSYNEILENPQPHAEKIGEFLDNSIDVSAMTRMVDQSLHRQRA